MSDSEDLTTQPSVASYGEDSIKTLEWQEHIRRRPGMYIGKLGDGTQADDGIYVLIKEVIDNSIDEFMMGFGKRIDVTLSPDGHVSVRDFGRGIPLGSVVDVASKMNTGGKYDNAVFQKSIGLNGVGIKAVNALSTSFTVTAFRDGQMKCVEFSRGKVSSEHPLEETSEKNGTLVQFTPDAEIFENYAFRDEFIIQMLKNYSYLNRGLTLTFNGEKFQSQNGVVDLMTDNMTEDPLYPIIHLETADLEIAMTHCDHYGEEYYTFVNGQHTTQGGTHLQAFKEAVVKTLRDYYGKNYDVADIRSGLTAVVSIRIQEPVFESQTKTKLGSKDMSPEGGVSIRAFVGDFLAENLDNYLRRNLDTADVINRKIVDSEKERKAISGIQKEAREKAKKANLHNKKLRDCTIHLTDANNDRREETAIFITEGDSASGSITKSRDAKTQAVFSLRGKPLNTFGLRRDTIYKNEEFFLLQSALNIEDGIDGLRYNKIIIATDADVDGMHIRLLMITFFLQFFPEVIKNGHLFILQTPLFRVRNKKKTLYCYSEEERDKAAKQLGAQREITRFKGLGEINWQEFKEFIGPGIRLDTVTLKSSDSVHELLEFYMGKNTSSRQNFIIDNLVIEEDLIDKDLLVLQGNEE
ncbi:MAG: type IIA DNA topoisomerase subunit B [Bacteroidales bacterium]|nr:type IIA DNA topoisomerase subunit B [Bacteroidales bacterium]MDY4174396.1 DNA topoisomerase IV subunit B [Bacteroidales bacterium]